MARTTTGTSRGHSRGRRGGRRGPEEPSSGEPVTPSKPITPRYETRSVTLPERTGATSPPTEPEEPQEPQQSQTDADATTEGTDAHAPADSAGQATAFLTILSILICVLAFVVQLLVAIITSMVSIVADLVAIGWRYRGDAGTLLCNLLRVGAASGRGLAGWLAGEGLVWEEQGTGQVSTQDQRQDGINSSRTVGWPADLIVAREPVATTQDHLRLLVGLLARALVGLLLLILLRALICPIAAWAVASDFAVFAAL